MISMRLKNYLIKSKMKDIIKIRKTVEAISGTGSSVDMEKLLDIFECAIKGSESSIEYQKKIYSIAYGFHFNKQTLSEALDLIGGMRMTCNEIEAALRSANITYSSELTIEDISYAVHMMISDYHSLNLSDNTIFSLAVAYCEDEDYPVRYGKCFIEWFNKVSLMKL